MNRRLLATQSFQFLRGKAHKLLEDIFPDKKKRYRWLVRNSPDIHMSRLDKDQLSAVIAKLEGISPVEK